MNEKYDKNNNIIYYKESDGYEYWYKYNENNTDNPSSHIFINHFQ